MLVEVVSEVLRAPIDSMSEVWEDGRERSLLGKGRRRGLRLNPNSAKSQHQYQQPDTTTRRYRDSGSRLSLYTHLLEVKRSMEWESISWGCLSSCFVRRKKKCLHLPLYSWILASSMIYKRHTTNHKCTSKKIYKRLSVCALTMQICRTHNRELCTHPVAPYHAQPDLCKRKKIGAQKVSDTVLRPQSSSFPLPGTSTIWSGSVRLPTTHTHTEQPPTHTPPPVPERGGQWNGVA